MASDTAGMDALAQELRALPPASHSAAERHAEAFEARREYLATPTALAVDNVPDHIEPRGVPLLQKEGPRHRDMVLLRMAGFTTAEIAAELNVTTACVNIALRQPWARKRLIEHLHKSRENVVTFLEREAAASVVTLVELRDDSEAPKAVRRQAADSLLDRYLGKAPQTVNLNRTEVPQDVVELERRIVAAQAEEKRLRGN